MTTTLTAYAGKYARNYCTLPTIDVPVLPDVSHCKNCGAEVRYQHPDQKTTWHGEWVHVEPSGDHYTAPRTRCSYCHTDDPTLVHYRQHPYHDATECDRCGGVSGFPIGD